MVWSDHVQHHEDTNRIFFRLGPWVSACLRTSSSGERAIAISTSRVREEYEDLQRPQREWRPRDGATDAAGTQVAHVRAGNECVSTAMTSQPEEGRHGW
jgi:hypothetical protein